MKVLHVSAGNNDGAGKGAWELHLALRRRGVDSRFVTLVQTAVDDGFVTAIARSFLRRLGRFVVTKLDQCLCWFYPRRSRNLFSCGLFGYALDHLPGYADVEIIHLHWINHGMIRMSSLRRGDKPIVWTMRDMWPFTGGCHYAFECNRYSTTCGCCPHLKSRLSRDLSRIVFQNKRIHLAKCRLYPVAISNWLKECAQDSAILRQRDVALIHNGIDANKYKPIPKHKARQAIGLPLDARIILFGAIGVDSPYKGFDLLCQARAKIDADVFFVTFGNLGTSVLEDLHAPYRHMGYVRDIGQLSEIYSAADLFVAPSRMEAFGKTIVEALACGTPVVCFDSGGPRDIVIHQQVGFRAIPFQSESLAEGINWCLNEMAVNEVHLRAACRKHAETNFDINGKIVTQYIDLYAKLLEDRSNSCLEQA